MTGAIMQKPRPLPFPRPRHLLQLLCLTALGLGSQALGQARTVYDERLPTPEPRLTEQERGRIQYLAGQAIKQNLWNSADMGCNGQDFTINGVAPGSFTKPNSKQTAYLYMACYSRSSWNQGLVIVEGRTVVAHYVFSNLYSEMYALKDINRNGYSELALVGGFTGTGETVSDLHILELRPQRKILASFDYQNQLLVHDDNCGAVESGGTWKSLVIRVIPGPNPKFSKQQISGQCSNERQATQQGPILPVTVKATPTGWIPGPLK